MSDLVERLRKYRVGAEHIEPITQEAAARIEQLEAERDAWRASALSCGKMLMSFTPGGSEYFGKRIGDHYTTDEKVCGALIREKLDALHKARCDLVLANRENARLKKAAKPIGIYIASKTTHAAQWRTLRDRGAPIISTWIDEAGAGETSNWPDLWSRCVSEASSASALVVFRNENSEVLKGAWVEVGAALASGVPVFAVGCGEFSFRHHPLVFECKNLGEAFERAALAGKEPT